MTHVSMKRVYLNPPSRTSPQLQISQKTIWSEVGETAPQALDPEHLEYLTQPKAPRHELVKGADNQWEIHITVPSSATVSYPQDRSKSTAFPGSYTAATSMYAPPWPSTRAPSAFTHVTPRPPPPPPTPRWSYLDHIKQKLASTENHTPEFFEPPLLADSLSYHTQELRSASRASSGESRGAPSLASTLSYHSQDLRSASRANSAESKGARSLTSNLSYHSQELRSASRATSAESRGTFSSTLNYQAPVLRPASRDNSAESRCTPSLASNLSYHAQELRSSSRANSTESRDTSAGYRTAMSQRALTSDSQSTSSRAASKHSRAASSRSRSSTLLSLNTQESKSTSLSQELSDYFKSTSSQSRLTPDYRPSHLPPDARRTHHQQGRPPDSKASSDSRSTSTPRRVRSDSGTTGDYRSASSQGGLTPDYRPPPSASSRSSASSKKLSPLSSHTSSLKPSPLSSRASSALSTESPLDRLDYAAMRNIPRLMDPSIDVGERNIDALKKKAQEKRRKKRVDEEKKLRAHQECDNVQVIRPIDAPPSPRVSDIRSRNSVRAASEVLSVRGVSVTPTPSAPGCSDAPSIPGYSDTPASSYTSHGPLHNMKVTLGEKNRQVQQWLSESSEGKSDARSNLLGMEGVISGQEVKQKCLHALEDVGASEQFSEFFSDVVACEWEMNTTLRRLHQSLGVDTLDAISTQPDRLFRLTQELLRNFHRWRGTVDALNMKGRDMPPLTVDCRKLKHTNILKALCSVSTKEVLMNEGDEVTITDTTRPNRVKIRTRAGQEGYIPALCCVLPAPDKSPSKATQRLGITLLASWVESVKKVRRLLMTCLLATSKMLTTSWRQRLGTSAVVRKERVSRRFRRLHDTITKQAPQWDYNKLHHALFSLERELDDSKVAITELTDMMETVASLDKSVLCYQQLTKQLHLFRREIEGGATPIRILDHLDQMPRPTRPGRRLKYFEVKMTMEEVEIVEEVTEEPEAARVPAITRPPLSPSGALVSGQRGENIQAEEITSSSHEERRRFIIKGVIEPRTGAVISIQEAVTLGLVNQELGLYVDALHHESLPIPEAMERGLIKVEQVETTRTKEETRAIGLITIRTSTENQQYRITGVMEAVSGRLVTAEEARQSLLVNEEEGTWRNSLTGETFPLDQAIQAGWVHVEYDMDPGEVSYDTKIYAVNAVVDQQLKKKIPFYDAVRRGLIDKETGTYINNVTGEAIYVVDAIQRGFLKAKVIEDASGLDIDAENRVVIERMNNIRRNLVAPLGILKSWKKMAEQ